MVLRSSLVRVASRASTKRGMADAPRTHKAKAVWSQIEATRPDDPHHHPMFEPPYGAVGAAVLVCSIVGFGYGSMYMGMRHQQYKQGYWK